MLAKEAESLRLELLDVFQGWAQAINAAGGQADDNWLMTEYPNICKLCKVMRIDLPNLDKDLPF